jgi:hypothetical protein
VLLLLKEQCKERHVWSNIIMQQHVLREQPTVEAHF